MSPVYSTYLVALDQWLQPAKPFWPGVEQHNSLSTITWTWVEKKQFSQPCPLLLLRHLSGYPNLTLWYIILCCRPVQSPEHRFKEQWASFKIVTKSRLQASLSAVLILAYEHDRLQQLNNTDIVNQNGCGKPIAEGLSVILDDVTRSVLTVTTPSPNHHSPRVINYLGRWDDD